jgi:hypothetical protein
VAATTSALALLAVGKYGSEYLYSRQAAKGVERQGAFEAAQLERNAGFADRQAEEAILAGKDQESIHRANVRGLIGAQKVAAAAQGIAIDSGSAMDLQVEAAAMGEMDALRIRNQAALEAWGYKVQASEYRAGAAMTRAGARNQAGAIRAQGYGTLLTGALDVANLYASSYTPKSGPKYQTVGRGPYGMPIIRRG